MALNESLGGVSVTIEGDLGPLGVAFTEAQAKAQQAGAGVAAAFTAGSKTIAGAQAAVKTATENLASAQKQLASFIVAGNAEAIAAVAGYRAELAAATANLTQIAGAAAAAAGAQVSLAAGAEVATVALHSEVSEIQAASGALRVLEGSGGIRAAERLLTMVPGLGAALKMAFPLVGAIALYEAFDKLIGKASGLKEAEDELAQQTKATDDAFSKFVHTIDSINVSAIARNFGAAAGQLSKAKMIGEEAKDAAEQVVRLTRQIAQLDSASQSLGSRVLKNPILAVPFAGSMFEEGQLDKKKAIQQQIDAIQVDGLVKQRQIDDELAQAAKTSAQDEGSLLAVRIANRISANTALGTLTRTIAEISIESGHQARQAQINEIADSQSRAVASAAERVRVALETRDIMSKIDFDTTARHIAQVRARTAADTMGKTPVEAQRIRTTSEGEVAGLNAAQFAKETELQGAYLKALGALDDAEATRQRDLTAEIVKEGEKRLSIVNKQIDDILAAAKRGRETAVRIGEIEAKGKGDAAAAGLQANKLAFERAYGDLSTHTAAQNVEYARQLAGYDAQSRAAKIAGLQAELAIAQKDYDNENHLIKAATIEKEIQALKLAGANAEFAADTKRLQDLEKLTLQYKVQAALRSAAQAVPGAIGNALATGLTGGGPKKENVGQQVADALKGIGVHLLGSIFTAMIEKLIASLITQFGLEILTQWMVHATPNPLGMFAAGGRPPIGVPSWVGESGKELWVPDEAGTIVPNHMLGSMTMPGISSSSSHTSSSSSIGAMNFHIHEARDTREVVRAIAGYLKSASPEFSTAGSRSRR
jgi:hypothetical protein